MTNNISTRVCPVEIAGGLDNSLRRLIQNPRRILRSYIHEGMTVLDMGCGPGFFTIEIAKMLNASGKVIAADLQDGMLEKVRMKISGTALEKIIKLHKCGQDKLGLHEKADFILAFYMIHEVPDKEGLFMEFKSILKPEGKLYIVEPAFHVSEKEFNDMLFKITNTGFSIIERPRLLLSRSVLLSLSNR